MLSFKLRSELDYLREALVDVSEFTKWVDNISRLFDGLDDVLIKLFGVSQTKMPEAVSELRQFSNPIATVVKGINPRKVFNLIEGLLTAIEKTYEFEFEDVGLVRDLERELNAFSGLYEAYIDSYGIDAAVRLISAAGRLLLSIKVIVGAVELSHRNLEESSPRIVGSSELSLYLSDVQGLHDFAGKLMALNNLYEALGRLLNVDVAERPISIQKIESGSLWSKVFGDSKIIGLMIDLLRGSASYMYREYTREGKVSSVPAKLDSMNAVLEFSKRLQDLGVDTDEIHEELRRATVGIAKNLNVLIESQSEIRVNGEPQSLALEVSKSLSYNSWVPQIPYDPPKIEIGKSVPLLGADPKPDN
ncbi:hypothetical protein PSm6_11640 [Pseudomonas solani]|uniref:Uncharacterized protein n=1 Tax=Pseudomonas solani TaxID=2731552 RepID=A0ABM7L5G5_9PSED|nr:hypothetical protein [Pseudomonas solani]BCD84757.1 hypothetical protein PSm6_11640 [Pseudomonas solani]